MFTLGEMKIVPATGSVTNVRFARSVGLVALEASKMNMDPSGSLVVTAVVVVVC